MKLNNLMLNKSLFAVSLAAICFLSVVALIALGATLSTALVDVIWLVALCHCLYFLVDEM